MAKVKDVLIHVIVETAVKQRKCHRTHKHHVSAGAPHMVIKDGLSRRNYCCECAKDILGLASSRLTSIREQLGITSF